MADLEPDRVDEGVGPGRMSPPPGMPRWVKVSLIIAAVLALIVVIAMLTGGPGQHSPARHGGLGAQTSTAVTDLASRLG